MMKIVQFFIVCASIICVYDCSTASILPLIVGGMYGFMIYYNRDITYTLKEKMCIGVLSFFFSVCMVLGRFEVVFSHKSPLVNLMVVFISVAGLTLLFQEMLLRVVYFLRDDSLIINKNVGKYSPKRIFIYAFIGILAAWGISYAIAYPGNITWDSSESIEQALGVSKIDVSYPLFMIYWLRFCLNVGYTLGGTYNLGVAFYLISQMVVFALAVSYVIYRLYKLNVKIGICFIIFLFYAVMPYNANYSHTLLKDVPFTICTLVFVQFIWEYYCFNEPVNIYAKWGKLLIFIISGVGMALSRTNGYYAFLFFLPFGLFLFFKRHKKICIAFILMFICIRMIQGPVFNYFAGKNNELVAACEYPPYDVRYKNVQEVQQSEAVPAENVSVENVTVEVTVQENTTQAPKEIVKENATDSYSSTGFYIMTIQQLGRVVVDRELSQDEYEELSVFFDVERMREDYKKHNVNKALALVDRSDTEGYLNTWLKYAFRYPYTYIIAWRDQTYGYWYPDIQYGTIYSGVSGEAEDVYADSLFPDSIVELRLKIDDAYTRIPVYGLFWSIGFVVWLTFFGIALTIIKQSLKNALIYIPLIGVWLTLLVATPVYAEFRYIYPFFICLPLSMIIPFIKDTREEQ